MAAIREPAAPPWDGRLDRIAPLDGIGVDPIGGTLSIW